MTKTLALALLGVFLVLSSTLYADCNLHLSRDFFSHFPDEGTFQLSDGTVVSLPSHFYESEGINLVGTVDANFALSKIDSSIAKPILLPNGRALVFITFLFTTKHDTGPQNALSINLVVQTHSSKTDPRGPRFAMPTHTISIGMFGDSRISKLVDTEVWGHSKELVNFQKTELSGVTHLQLSNDAGVILNLDFNKEDRGLSMPLTMKSLVHPVSNQSRQAPLFFRGNFKILMGSNHGRLIFNPNHPLAQQFSMMGLNILAWQYSKKLKGVYLKDTP